MWSRPAGGGTANHPLFFFAPLGPSFAGACESFCVKGERQRGVSKNENGIMGIKRKKERMNIMKSGDSQAVCQSSQQPCDRVWTRGKNLFTFATFFLSSLRFTRCRHAGSGEEASNVERKKTVVPLSFLGSLESNSDEGEHDSRPRGRKWKRGGNAGGWVGGGREEETKVAKQRTKDNREKYIYKIYIVYA